MCGRYAITATAERIEQAFDSIWEQASLDAGRGAVLPRFNVAPTQWCPVVRVDEGDRRIAAFMRWGLVPSWADDPSIGQRLINARVETAASKPSFRAAWKRRRCLVPVTHFFEWRREGAHKQPMAIRSPHDGALLALAGLWESWRDELRSFTILTTEPNERLRPIHDRMPLILAPDRWTRWLDPAWGGPSNGQELTEWSAPAPDEWVHPYPVSPLVNSPRNDSPECVAAVA